MTEGDSSSELTPEQEDTANLLERVLGRAISNRYVDFCRLASGAFELRVSRPIAGHALRELESTLRDALKVPLEVKAVAAAIDPEKLDTARRALEEMGFDGAAVERAASALQPRETHATQIEQITARLGLAPGGDIAKAWISLVKTFGQVHKRSFHHSLTVDDEFRRDFQRPFDTVVRAVTVALQRRYSALTRRVDEIAAMPATERALTLFARGDPGRDAFAVALLRAASERRLAAALAQTKPCWPAAVGINRRQYRRPSRVAGGRLPAAHGRIPRTRDQAPRGDRNWQCCRLKASGCPLGRA